jgi:hypothetical protein
MMETLVDEANGMNSSHDGGLTNGDHGASSGDDVDGAVTPESGQSAQSALDRLEEALRHARDDLGNGINRGSGAAAAQPRDERDGMQFGN